MQRPTFGRSIPNDRYIISKSDDTVIIQVQRGADGVVFTQR
ncbi:hypothetical protein TBK1r_54660 [Stieleria magnilauensis]|uniref:Uncharacterized protein n=1 Tax=Stieleria magnilauensis TaxID=2527963 RepID=A0ABX5XY43_9BACT|nr:hypothetical protein TBK1r_54660 [Planctomycetes bacterium TBK1r]